MKWAFQLAITERARSDKKLILIIGDVGAVMFKQFRDEMPDQFINIGICEQTMVGVAAGLAMEGFRPVLYTITPFLIERAFEQIKIDIDQQDLGVGLVGYCDDQAGPTHLTRYPGQISMLWPNVVSYFPLRKQDIAPIVLGAGFDHPWFLSLGPARE